MPANIYTTKSFSILSTIKSELIWCHFRDQIVLLGLIYNTFNMLMELRPFSLTIKALIVLK